MRQTIVDAGPLVALLDARETHHEWASNVMGSLTSPLLTCEAVVSEACFIVRKIGRRHTAVLDLLSRGVLTIGFELEPEIAAVQRLMAYYADLPMSLADACLVRMTELAPDSVVLTLDSHFRIYRRHGRQPVPTIMPE